MSIARNRILSLALAICLLLAMTLVVPGPVEVSAADVKIEQGPPDVTVYETVIGFAGHQWVVIGDESDGISTGNSNYITVLLETDDTGFSSTTFRTGNNTLDDPSWTHFPGDNRYYEGNFNQPNDYNDSTLQNEMTATANTLQASSAKEYALIEGRTIGTDGIGGASVGSQDLWPLSYDERYDIYTDTYDQVTNVSDVLKFTNGDWWLRSPYGSNGRIAWVGSASGSAPPYVFVYFPRALRPAFQLNLESVLFTSDASGASKSSIAVGDPLKSAASPQTDAAIKLTVEDEDMSLIGVDTTTPITATQGQSFDIAYTSATPGSNNYISCVLVKSGEVQYYGKLEAASVSGGNAIVKLPTDIAPGDYTLRVFVEEINGANETDFASKPKEIQLTVNTPTAAELEVTAPTFSPVTLGYSQQPDAEAITITNIGGANATITDVSVSDTTKFTVISHGNTTITTGGSNTDWMVQPNMGLPEDTHTATITVTYDGGVGMTGDIATAQVQFVVRADTPQPGTPTLIATPTNIDFEDVEVDTAEEETVAVSGTDLTGNITYNISGDSDNVFRVATGTNWNNASGGNLVVTFEPTEAKTYRATLTLGSSGAGDVTVPLTGKGVSDGEGDPEPPNPPEPPPGPEPIPNPGPSTNRDRSSDRGGSSTPDAPVVKTTLPSSAFSWDGARTLTIDHERITPLGLLPVQWDGVALTRGTEYSVYQGSVIVRFSEDFIAAQSPGNHTVRVEFLNHTGETTVTVGETGLTSDEPNDDLFDNNTHNPNTGGYPDGGMGGTDNPNTGDRRGIWSALLLVVVSAVAIAWYRWNPENDTE